MAGPQPWNSGHLGKLPGAARRGPGLQPGRDKNARARLGMLKSLLGKDGVPGSSGVLGPPACVSPLRAACGGISGFSCSGQGGQSGGLPPARGVCHSSSAPGVAHTPVWLSHTKEDGAEVGAAAHRESGAAGVVQEDGGVLPRLWGGSVVSLGACGPASPDASPSNPAPPTPFSRFLPSSISLLRWLGAPCSLCMWGRTSLRARVKLSLQNSGRRAPLPPQAWPLTPLVEPL